MNLSRFFTLDELTYSSTAAAKRIDNHPGAGEIASLRALCTAVLDPLREVAGQPIKVTSGYRGPALNRFINGAVKSQHLSGQAADIQSPGMAVLELFKTVIRFKLPFDQIIYEVKGASKWVHVSHHPGANRGEILLARFGADGKVTYPRITAQQALEMTEPVTRGMGFAGEPGYVETADEPEDEAPMARGVKQAAPKKGAPRRPAAKKVAAKKPTTKKPMARKTPPKSATAKKAAARRRG